MRRSGAITVLGLLLVGSSVASSQTTMPSYPNSTEGLKSFFQDMLKAVVARDGNTVLAMSHSLYLPDPDAWFKRVFGEKNARTLVDEYKTHMIPKDPKTMPFDYSLATAFMNLRDPDKLTVVVSKVEDTDD